MTESNADSLDVSANSRYDFLIPASYQTLTSSPEDNMNVSNIAQNSKGTKERAQFCDNNCESNCGSPCDWSIDPAKKTPCLLASDKFNTSTPGEGRSRKHITRACLECRKRHVRCDGQLPVCKKCSDNNRECSYVPSNRGGVRIPRKKLQQEVEVNNDGTNSAVAVEAKPFHANANAMSSCGIMTISSMSPDMRNTTNDGRSSPGFEYGVSAIDRGEEMKFDNTQKPAQELQGVIDGVVALSPYLSSNQTSSHLDSPDNTFQHSNSSYSYDSYSATPTADLLNIELPANEIINIYYASFHHRHPILPAKRDIVNYLDATKGTELIQVMGFIAHLLTSSGPPQADDIFLRIQVVKAAIDQAPEDLVKLQSAVLLSIVAHLCTDNATSIELRTWFFDLCYRVLSDFALSTHATDGTTNAHVNLLSSWRTSQVDKSLLAELVAKIFHEVFFLDIMFSIITRGQPSPFVVSNLMDSIPIDDVPEFAYKCRFRTMKVVRSIMMALTSMGSSIQSSVEFTKLEALVTTFQGLMSDELEDESQAFPPLLDDLGNVDDGIHQSIIMLNFASILLHFPFSSLYQNKLPSYVQCTDDSAPIVHVQSTHLSKQRTIVSTRRCIQAANNIIQIVTDIGSSQTPLRTPLYSCSLAMAMLVHMKAYHWLTRPSSTNKQPRMDETRRLQEIGLYEAYIKLENSSLSMFGSKWIISNKLNASLCNVMFTVLPELYEKVVETEIRPKRKAEEPLVEKDCWMKNLRFDETTALTQPSLDIFDQLFDLDTMAPEQ